ncbi:MAG: type I-MYXAN CRISPR-associated protein Cas6/Cmx6 [Thermosynechococcaceae cyanobacterium MS004]|nr:type I-MYXAN CRISPR-associated protein Cas6/Cmx6 [Thermosynechococcaceae cyanobacterium MS004]
MNFLEIQFALGGTTKTLPADHGYALYSAVKHILQKAEVEPQDIPAEVKLCSVSGVPNREGKIYLHQRSRFRLRCPAEQVQTWYRLLQNQELNIRGHKIRLTRPRLTLPRSSEILKARMVTFKLESVDHPELPHYFLESCKKGIERLEIKGSATFIPSNDDGSLARRTLRVREKKIIGYSVVVEGLSEEDSLKLQWHGLGGRQHFGCGWFYPYKEEEYAS